MTGQIILALAAYWRRHPGQCLTLIAGLALATALWTAVQAINAEARASYASASAFFSTGQSGVLTSPDGQIDLSDYVTLRRAGWRVSPVLEGHVTTDTGRIQVMGIDFLTYPAVPDGADGSGGGVADPADVLLPPGRLLATSATAEALGGSEDLPQVLIADWVPEGVFVADIGIAETLLDSAGRLSRVVVSQDQPMGLPPLAEIAPHLVLQQREPQADLAGLTRSFHLNLTAFGLLSFAVGLFIVQGMIGLAFEQRRDIMRSLRALGVPAKHLAVVMLIELLAFGLFAGLLGIGLGYVIAATLLPDVAATLRGLYGAPVAGALALRPVWIAAGLGMSLAGVLVAGAHVLWRVRQMPVLALTSAEAWRGQNAGLIWLQCAGGIALICAGCAAVAIWDGLLAGFAFLGGLMLGTAVLLPPLLTLVLGFATRAARGPLAQWVWSDMRAQLPGLSLALMALLLALATNIGVGTMVASFRLTFTAWLDHRLSSDLYIAAASEAQADAMRGWLAGRAEAVLPTRSVRTTLAGRPARIYAIVDDPVYRAQWPMVRANGDVWEQVLSGQGVLVSEQLARRARLGLGDRIELKPGWSPLIAGLYADYGNPDGQVMVELETLLTHYPDLPDVRMAVRSEDPAALSRELRARFALASDAIVPQGAIKARSLEIFERTFLITGALNVLTLGVAGFAILTSLLTLWTLRLPQLAPVWALGLTRGRLARFEVARSLALATLTALAALPLGLVLAWALLSVIQVEAFGWRLPMFLFPLDWIRLFLLALLAAGLAALLPALRLYAIPPAGLLKVFADAR